MAGRIPAVVDGVDGRPRQRRGGRTVLQGGEALLIQPPAEREDCREIRGPPVFGGGLFTLHLRKGGFKVLRGRESLELGLSDLTRFSLPRLKVRTYQILTTINNLHCISLFRCVLMMFRLPLFPDAVNSR